MVNKVEITEELVKDLKDYGGQFAIGLATQVRDELTMSAKHAIELFYEDYTPIYYHRHYYNFLNNSYQKYYKNSHNSIVYGGVFLSPDGMDNIYQDDVEEVFDMVYAGYHGVSSGFNNPKSFTPTKVMSPSPLEIIKDVRNNIINNIETYEEYGVNRANKKSYNTLIKK